MKMIKEIILTASIIISYFTLSVNTDTINYIKGINHTKEEITVQDLQATPISVSCIKVKWKKEENREYKITVKCSDKQSQVTLNFTNKNTCYITGLRENSECKITVTPEKEDNEKSLKIKSKEIKCKTEKVQVLQNFAKEDGYTNCFAFESATGLTEMPSSGAIANTIVDPITNTGIKRNEYGDYCCAMGLFYGNVGDRFLVELENGTQFTVEICDSKGLASDGKGKYHTFSTNGKCLIEFIVDENFQPSDVKQWGNYGRANWNGLDLRANIKSIKKISFGKKVNY